MTSKNCVARCGEGDVLKKQEVTDGNFSVDFQWLPCEVDISGDDGQARQALLEIMHLLISNDVFAESRATSITYTLKHINISMASSKKSSLLQSPCGTAPLHL